MLNFRNGGHTVSAATATANEQLTAIRRAIKDGEPIIPNGMSSSVLAMESADVGVRTAVADKMDGLQTTIKSIGSALKRNFPAFALEAAAVAGLHASNWKQFVNHKPTSLHSDGEANSSLVSPLPMDDMVPGRWRLATEAYDETSNRQAVSFNISYQLGAASQDPFGELLWPTIVMDPTKADFEIVADIMTVYDRVEHNIDGTAANFAKKNLIRAIADPSILKKDQNKALPVVRPENVAQFIAAATVAPVTVTNGEESFPTAPLLAGKKLNLIGLCQTDMVISAGGANMTDSLDPYAVLKNVYVAVTVGANTDVLRLKTSQLPYSNFTPSTQDNYRRMTLAMHTTSVIITKATLQADGSPLDALAPIVANNWYLRLEMNANGYINIETGELHVTGKILDVSTLQDSTGRSLSLTAAPQGAIVSAITGVDVLGFDIDAFKSNLNRRQQGQYVDMTRFYQRYRVPMRSPITAIHPAHEDGTVDASDIQQLIQYTRTRVANESVTAVLDSAALLSEFTDIRDDTNVGPDLLGIGRHYIRPVYFEDTVNMTAVVDSRTSTDRFSDVRAALLNIVRNYVYEAWRQSEYAAASQALNGGMAMKPTVTIATDPYIAQYLMADGDVRTLGPEFPYEVVSTLDYRMRGRLFITFSVMDDNRNVVPNPLSFGNRLWAPELALTANISRGNTFSKESVVQPRYLFIMNCPIMVALTVENIPAVLSKVTVNTKVM